MLAIKVAAPLVPIVVKVIASCLAFQVPELAILTSANVPVQPNVKLVACSNARVGVPPNVRVTLVSSTLVRAAGVTEGIEGKGCHDLSPLQ